MIIGTIKRPDGQEAITLMKGLGYRAETTCAGSVRIWKGKEGLDAKKKDGDAK